MSALRIDQLHPGDVLYDVRSERAGHTAMSRTSWYRVVVVSVDTTAWTITARWHHDPPAVMSAQRVRSLRRSIPTALAREQGLATTRP